MSRGERKGSETTKENSENEPLEIAETIEYFEEDKKTFQKPLDKSHKVWYNKYVKRERGVRNKSSSTSSSWKSTSRNERSKNLKEIATDLLTNT